MGLIVHHALKDIRAQRWLVAAWAAMLVATCVIEAFKLDVPLAGLAVQWVRLDVGTGRSPLVFLLFSLHFSLALARVSLAWVLAIRFVHADPAEGTDAFWLTRPISRGMLLAAKAGLVGGLLLLVPGLAAAFVFLMNGVPWSSLPLTVLAWVLIDALLLMPLALLATMTRDLARMVLSVLLAAIAWTGVQFASFLWMAAPVEAFRGTRPAWPLLAATLVSASAWLAARQYLGRRTARTALASVAVLVAIAVAAGAWPVRAVLASDRKIDPPEWTQNAGVAVSIPPDSLRVRAYTAPRPGGPITSYTVHGGLRVDGLPAGGVVHLLEGTASLRIAGEAAAIDRSPVHAYGPGFSAGDLIDPASRQHFEEAIGATLLDRRYNLPMGLHLLWVRNAAEFERYRQRPGLYQATATFEAMQIRSVVSVPLRQGASAFVNGVEYSILSTRRAQSSMRLITLRVASPRAWTLHPPRRVEVAIRNRSRKEAIVAWHDAFRRAGKNLTATFVVTTPGVAAFEARHAGGTIDHAWLADAELVMVSLEPLGRFERTIKIENFALPTAQNPTTTTGRN